MRSFVLRIIVIENYSAGVFPLKEESEHCFLSIKVLFWYRGLIYCVVLLLFSAIFMFQLLFYIWYFTEGKDDTETYESSYKRTMPRDIPHISNVSKGTREGGMS
jgi:hypothetical protein